MALMNGDPVIELEYRKWKESMITFTTYAGKAVSHLQIIKANPLGETVWIQRTDCESYPTSNQRIFDALADIGMTPERLEKKIPKVGWEYLGTYLGAELGLDTQGRFQIGPFPDQPEPEVVEANANTSCQHGFVVRDTQGPNRFLCRECDERFLSYPEKDKFKPKPNIIDAHQEALLLKNAMDVYQAGFLGRMHQEGYTWAQGVVMKDTKIYNLPLSDSFTQSVQFMGDKNEPL